MIEKTITLDLNGKYKPFNHFFEATGYANTDFTYTPPVKRLYDHLQSYNNHPRYMRLHNIMTSHGKGYHYKFTIGSDYGNLPYEEVWDDIVVKRAKDGSFEYDWTVVDTVYDIILGHEMKPIVEMMFIPTVITHPEDRYIPCNYREYYEVVKAFVTHWTERYGAEEVKTWYFEITNEPDNCDIFVNHSEYFNALYDYFVAGVTDVNSEYQVGGPAVKQWEEGKKVFKYFLHHCAKGVNYVTGGYGTRIDFISVHCKAGRPELVGPDTDYMFNSLREYVEMMEPYPQYKNIPFFNDESDIVWDGNRGTWVKSWLNFRNTEYAPAFMCKMMNTYTNVIEDELGINLAIVDSDNCHLLWERDLFSGNRSQMTPLGKAPCTDIIKKGFFNAGMLLGKLGYERLVIDSDDEEFCLKYGCLATKHKDDKGYAFMVWNFEDGLNDDVNARRIKLSLKGLKGKYKLIVHQIDKTHSNPYNIYKEMGYPYPVNKEQIYKLRDNDSLYVDPSVVDFNGSEITFDYPMHSVALFSLVREDTEEVLQLKRYEKEMSVLNEEQNFIIWDYSKRIDFIGYNIYRDGKKLNNNLLTASTFVDSDIEKGKEYSYKVETIYAYGKCMSEERVF